MRREPGVGGRFGSWMGDSCRVPRSVGGSDGQPRSGAGRLCQGMRWSGQGLYASGTGGCKLEWFGVRARHRCGIDGRLNDLRGGGCAGSRRSQAAGYRVSIALFRGAALHGLGTLGS